MRTSVTKTFLRWCLIITLIGAACGDESLTQELNQRLSQPNRANIGFAFLYPKESAALLEEQKNDRPLFSKLLPLFQGELALRENDKVAAQKSFGEFLALIEPASSSLSYDDAAIPASFYLEIPKTVPLLEPALFVGQPLARLKPKAKVFLGLGSSSDNLLIRRLVDLDRTDLAAQEYDRLQEAHRLQGNSLRNELQFTWDHALFLEKNEQTKKATLLLITALLEVPHFEFQRDFLNSNTYSCLPPRVLTIDEFIRLSASFLRTNQQEATALTKLQEGGTASQLCTKARIHFFRGEEELALKWNLLALEKSELPAQIKSERLGDLYFDRKDYQTAAGHYQTGIEETQELSSERRPHPYSHYRLSHLKQQLDACYLKLNEHAKRLRPHLKQLEESKSLTANQWPNTLQRASHPETQSLFREWVQRMSKDESPFDATSKALLFEFLDDFPKVANCLLQESSKSHFNASYWKSSFQEHEQSKLYRETLKKLADQNPRSPSYLHPYLELYGKEANPAHAISFYEEFLLGDSPRLQLPVSQGCHYANFQTRKDEMARNLLSLYLKEEREEDFIKFGKKLCDPENPLSPFETFPNAIRYFFNRANPATLRECQKQFELKSPHLDFRLKGWALARPPTTANPVRIDEHSSALLSSNRCNCLASSPDYLVSGHEWGLTVYRSQHEAPIQIIIGAPISTLTIRDQTVFATNGYNVFQIDLETQAVNQFGVTALGQNPNSRVLDSSQSAFGRERILALATTDEDLWVGGRSSIFRVNLQARDLTTFSPQELDVTTGNDWSRLLTLSSGGIIASGRDESSRYFDPITEQWQKIPPVIARLENDEVWVKHWVNRRLGFRPARYQLKTGEVEVVPIEKKPEGIHWGQSVRDIRYWSHNQEEIHFLLNQRPYLYQRQTSKLQYLPKDSLSHSSPNPDYSCSWKNQLIQFSGHSLSGIDVNPRARTHFHYGNGKNFYGHPELISKASNETSKTLSDFALRGTVVYDLVEAPEGIFLCTSQGLTLVDRKAKILYQFDSRHGLPIFPCVTATSFNDKLYFGFAVGGIYVLSGTQFTPLTTMDGLLDDRIHNLTVEDGRLEVTYAKRDRNGKPFQFPSSFITSDGSHHYSTTEATSCKWYDEAPNPQISLIGGRQCRSLEIDKLQWTVGTTGLLVRSREAKENLSFPILALRTLENPMLIQKQEAEEILQERQPRLSTTEKVQHPNPFVAISAGYDAWYKSPENLARLLALSRHESHEIRRQAVRYLDPTKGPNPLVRNIEVMNRLEEMLDDPDAQVRHQALVEKCLAYSEEVPFDHLQRLLTNSEEDSDEAVKQILMRQLPIDLETLKLVLDYPQSSNAWSHVNTYWLPKYKFVGRQSSQDESLLAEILRTSDERSKNYNNSRGMIYSLMFHFDPAVLPSLHRSLQSTDRVVRANAALACGAIGHPSSIQPLIQALDFESGLSRSSIVFALGKLKAIEAIPILLEFDKQLQQSQASSRYPAGVASLNARPYSEPEKKFYPTDNEFELPATPEPKAARPDKEILLSRQELFDALIEIPSPLLQAYFRDQILEHHNLRMGLRLCVEKLTQGEGDDIPKNIETLKSVLTLNNLRLKPNEIENALEILQKKSLTEFP